MFSSFLVPGTGIEPISTVLQTVAQMTTLAPQAYRQDRNTTQTMIFAIDVSQHPVSPPSSYDSDASLV